MDGVLSEREGGRGKDPSSKWVWCQHSVPPQTTAVLLLVKSDVHTHQSGLHILKDHP